MIGCMIVTFLFYELLKYLNTPNLMFSTVSIVTSFLAATLTMLRSSYYALGYASNDIVLIILWVMASIKDPSYFPVVVNFMIFFLNDMYGFISWKKREAKIEEKIEIG
jgi:nicotinamide mononucleotide transporter